MTIGVRADGRKELIASTDGFRESAECWAGPRMNPSPASPDSLEAASSPTNTGLPSVSMPHAASTGSAAKNAQADVKADYWEIFDPPADVEPGIDAVKLAQNRIDAFAKLARLLPGGGSI